MEVYDVVIIGGGPAGLNCAEKLSKTGRKILLVEKKEIIGPKVCAGGLTSKDIEYLDLPDTLLERKYRAITVHTPFFKSKVCVDDGYLVCTVNRENLGQWQLGKLSGKDNVIIKTESAVTKIGKGYVVINNSKEIGFKYLVGADGSNSIVRRYLGLEIRDFNIAIQYTIPSSQYKEMELFLDSKLFNCWYAWIFPHKDYVSVGTGCNPNVLSLKKLRSNFEKWIEDKKIDISHGKFEAFSINYDYRGFRFGNIFLAGDAAGFASGLTGEGIYPALVSGEEVAKVIINRNHRPRKIENLVAAKRRQEMLLNLLRKSEVMRVIGFEVAALALKNRTLAKKLLGYFLL